MGEICWQEECAVMAVSLPSGTGTAAKFIYDGLRMQQHRGQDGSGIVLFSEGEFVLKKEPGLVYEVFSKDWLSSHQSDVGIGHNRYSTQGLNIPENLQPHYTKCRGGEIWIAGNGHVINYQPLRQKLEGEGEDFYSTNDGELMAKIIAKEYDRTGDIVKAIRLLRQTVKGAYSAVMLFQGKLFVFRDPKGFRPLCLAELPNGGLVVASETLAFDIFAIDPESFKEIKAGAILEITECKVTVHEEGHEATSKCIFEFIYFARPDSDIFGLSVALIRRRIGLQLAREFREKEVLEGDKDIIVIAVPDSSTQIALGVWQGLDILYEQGIIRSHTARRTFIESEQRIRDEGVKYKFNPLRLILRGKTVIVVDDSIVRGSTLKKLIAILRRAGVKAVHLLIGSPQIFWSCLMGIDTPTLDELMANLLSFEEEVKHLGVDSLTHISVAKLMKAVGPLTEEEKKVLGGILKPILEAEPGTYYAEMRERLERADSKNYCYACFTGEYSLPVPLPGARLIPEE